MKQICSNKQMELDQILYNCKVWLQELLSELTKQKHKIVRIHGDTVYRDFPIKERREKRKQVVLRLYQVTSQPRMLKPFVRSDNKPIFHN